MGFYKKKSLLTLLILLMLLSGCGSEEASAEGTDDDFTYAAQHYFFSIPDFVPYSSVFADDGSLYIAGREEDLATQLFCLAEAGKEPERIPLGLRDGAWICSMGRGIDGRILLACGQYTEMLEHLEMVTVSDGKIAGRVDVTNIFRDKPDFEAEHALLDETGTYYISSKKLLYVINSKGEPVFEAEAEAGIEEMFFSKNGENVLVILSDGSLWEIDKEAGRLRSLNNIIIFGNGKYTAGIDKDIVYSQGSSLYACDIKDKQSSIMLKWEECDLASSDVQCFSPYTDGKIAVFSAERHETGVFELALLRRTRRDEIPDKKIITYGYTLMDTLTNSQIVRFNKENTEYRIELKQYGDENADPETGKLLLQTDIVAGKGPDIIDIGLLFDVKEQYEFIETGVLEDLSPYLNNDEEIKRGDYLESALEAYAGGDKLFAIMPAFCLDFLVGKSADIEYRNSWTLGEMLGLIEERPEADKIMSGISRTEMMDILCTLNMNAFIEANAGDYQIDKKMFGQIIEIADRFPEEAEETNLPGRIEQVRSGEAFLMRGQINLLSGLQLYEDIFAEPVEFIGYPASSGKGVLARPSSSVLAISKGCKYKEGAWQFIRFLLEEDQQMARGLYGAQGFPVNKIALNRIFENEMKVKYREDHEGRMEETWKRCMQTEGLTFYFYAPTREEELIVKQLMEHVSSNMEWGVQIPILEIMKEESEAFFEDQKNLSEVIEVIENRINLYLAERK